MHTTLSSKPVVFLRMWVPRYRGKKGPLVRVYLRVVFGGSVAIEVSAHIVPKKQQTGS
jgi:hypothetical protein